LVRDAGHQVYSRIEHLGKKCFANF
jgi:hypothetical protein